MIVNEGRPGKKLPILSDPGIAANLLSGKQLIDQNGNVITGSMVNRGSVSQSLNCGSSYTIPQGYHSGGGIIRANNLASQTSATATAADIRSGKTAWVNGARLTGNGQMAGEVVTIGDVVDHGSASGRQMCLATSFGIVDFYSRGVNSVNLQCRVGEPAILVADNRFTTMTNTCFDAIGYRWLDYYAVAVYVCLPGGGNYYYISFET